MREKSSIGKSSIVRYSLISLRHPNRPVARFASEFIGDAGVGDYRVDTYQNVFQNIAAATMAQRMIQKIIMENIELGSLIPKTKKLFLVRPNAFPVKTIHHFFPWTNSNHQTFCKPLRCNRVPQMNNLPNDFGDNLLGWTM